MGPGVAGDDSLVTGTTAVIPQRGFRNAYHDARGEGWHVNHKKTQRL